MKIEKAGDTLNIDTELFTITQVGSVVKVDIQGLVIEKDAETGMYSINTIDTIEVENYGLSSWESGTIAEPDAEGWIKWEGGKCPVERGILVDVKYRDGVVLINLPALMLVKGRDASSAFWNHEDQPNDITFYRLSK